MIRDKTDANIDLFDEDKKEEKKKEKYSTWEKLNTIPESYMMIMILAQLLMFVFSFMFLFRKSDVGVYDKKDFKVFISF